MPYRPGTVCSTPTCRNTTTHGKCDHCRQQRDRATTATRGTAAQRGYGHAHRETFRAAVLHRDPVCMLCHRRPATVADHHPLSRRELLDHGLDPLDPAHGRGLCAQCDHIQTAQRQPGGFARH